MPCINFAAETHVDRSIAGAAELRGRRTWPASRSCCRRAWTPGSRAWSRSPPTRSTAAWRRVRGRRMRRWSRTRRTRRRRPAVTSWPGPTRAPTGSTSASPAAATTTARTSSRRRSSRCSSPTCSTGSKVPLYGDGRNVRGWIHVDDHCRGIQLVLEHGERGTRLPHQRRRRADQRGADRGPARMLRGQLGHGDLRRGPQGPRPPLLARRLGAAGHGLRARGSRSARACATPCGGTRRTASGGSR